VEVVQLLLENGVGADATDGSGRSPLSYAAEGGYVEVVQLLLEKGVGADVTDDSCRSPLSYAAEGGYVDVVEALLGKVSDPDIGQPLIYALRHESIVRLLLQNGADPFSDHYVCEDVPLGLAAERGQTTLVRLFLEKNVEHDSMKREHTETALVSASYEGHADVVQLLLDDGTFSHPAYHAWQDALEFAEMCGHSSVTGLLEAHLEKFGEANDE
jgi:ankyrin repeat protein